MAFLSHPAVADGETAAANLLDYHSGKITLSVKSSYDAELHACTDAGRAGENLQATFAELAHWQVNSSWSISSWLLQNGSERHPLFVVIDAKGLWTKIQTDSKTEKRGTIYVQ